MPPYHIKMKRSNDSMTKIVAEIGINHGGDFNKAMAMVQEAKRCGAHSAKFQFYLTDTLCLQRDCFGAYNILDKNKMHPQWIPYLKKECDRLGIEFSCTAFCKYSAEEIAPYVKSFKVASPEVCDTAYIKELAAYGKPIIISTGKANYDDLDRVFDITSRVTILYCVSKYPADRDDYDLSELDRLRERYSCPVGLSDHTQGIELAKIAAERGVAMIEKHFKVDDECVDAVVSITPLELAELCRTAKVLDRYK